MFRNIISLCSLLFLLISCTSTPIRAKKADNKTDNNTSTNPIVDDYDTAKYDIINELGFYDVDRLGAKRTVRNDLSGSLSGMVQFVQTHSVNPKKEDNNNSSVKLPNIVTDRESLILFTPTEDSSGTAGGIGSITMRVYDNGSFVYESKMSEPNLMPKADNLYTIDRQDVIYSKRSYSAVLPWNYVHKGLELRFIDNKTSREGVLTKGDISFGAPAEGVFVFIRLGMLAAYPTSGSDDMFSDAERATTEYFITAPYSKLINVYYEPRTLPKVIVASGVIYDSASSDSKVNRSQTNGDVYSGDMRGDVAKSQISVGINLANYGITSSSMSQSYPHLYFQNTIHLAQGLYLNGIQRHGLSGGNGIGTFVDTAGNEFSHEVGHAYGLGHFPGANGNDYYWSGHHSESGWGYDAYKKRMRANLAWHWDGGGAWINSVQQTNTTFGKDKLYSYNRDSMAGGEAVSAISRYTHYTGYSTVIIQNFLANKAVVSAKSPTGYYKWNATNEVMEEYSFPVAEKRLKPLKVGVPVFTLLGGYNPDNYTQALIYEPFRGNYGNTFKYPEPTIDKATKACWVMVEFESEPLAERIEVLSTKPSGMYGNAFQLNINIEEARKPTKASLYCKKASQELSEIKLLYSVNFPKNLEPLKKPIIVGKEFGYNAVAEFDKKALNLSLPAYKDNIIPILSAKEREMINSIGDNITGIDGQALVVLNKYKSFEDSRRKIIRYINKYKNEILSDNQTRVDGLFELVDDVDLIKDNSSIDKLAGALSVEGKYMKAVYDNASKRYLSSVSSGYTGANEELWIMDQLGRIHNLVNLNLCLASAGGQNRLNLVECRVDDNSQQWVYNDTTYVITSKSNSNIAIDFNRGAGYPITYSKTSSSNQQWRTMKFTKNILLILLPYEYFKIVEDAR